MVRRMKWRTSENQKSWLWRRCRRRAGRWFSRSHNKLAHPDWRKSTGAGRYRLLSRWYGTISPPSNCVEKLLRKVRTLWHCSRLRSVAFYLWLIVWWYPSGNRPLQQYLGYAEALVMVSSSIRLTAWLQIQRSGRNGQVDVWAESPRSSPLWISASSSACHGLLIITVITPLPTKPLTKMPENWSWTRQLLTCRCVSVMLLRSMPKYTKG